MGRGVLAASDDALTIRYFPLENHYSAKPVLDSIRNQRTVALIGTAQLRKNNATHFKAAMERIKRVADVNNARMLSIEADMFLVLPQCTVLEPDGKERVAAAYADDAWPEDEQGGKNSSFAFSIGSNLKDIVAYVQARAAPKSDGDRAAENALKEKIDSSGARSEKSERMTELEEMKRMVNGGQPGAVAVASVGGATGAGEALRKKMFGRRVRVIEKMHLCRELFAEGRLKERDYRAIKSELDRELQHIDYVLSGKPVDDNEKRTARRSAKKHAGRKSKRGR